MAKVLTDNQNYYGIADAIRSKLGVETLFLPSEMAAAIEAIETGTDLTSEDEGKVVVEDAGSYVLTAQTSMSISENGTYDTTTINELIANIEGGGGGGDYTIDWDTAVVKNESSVAVTKPDGGISFAWNGGGQIGANAFIPIYVPEGSKSITYKLTTGSSYGTTDPRKFCVGIIPISTGTASWVFSDSQAWEAVNIHDTNNMPATEFTIDMSQVSGGKLLCISAHGWTATVSDVKFDTGTGGGGQLADNILLQGGTMNANIDLVSLQGNVVFAPTKNGIAFFRNTTTNTGYLLRFESIDLTDYNEVVFELDATGIGVNEQYSARVGVASSATAYNVITYAAYEIIDSVADNQTITVDISEVVGNNYVVISGYSFSGLVKSVYLQ